ncbi:ACT domain-containing protein [Candidatus Villigracilis affinis]|uniref:ACT domain-containing protein n=1 Tax=Candidatus Villigracilis affinis TaxID=3140682 RepID=UPI001E054D26|nr:ACT domain-containing protein [Anaerolineales bacterium]
MSGEINITKLLQNMKPELNAGEYVYCLADSKEQVVTLDPLCYFLEKEGVTMILPKEKADAMSIPYATTCAWITLTVHSSLEAVGLTAAVSKALTEANISCNIVAAFYHDHIFVPIADAPRAMDALFALTKS